MPPELKRMETRAYVRSIDVERKRLTAYVSTAALASDGMIVLPRAWAESMPLFMANPVIPWQHDYDRPTGQAIAWEIDSVGLSLTITFNMKDEDGIKAWNAYEGGFMRAFSVGFAIDKRTGAMKPKEILEQFGSELPDFVKADLDAIVAGDRDVPGGMWGMAPDGITVVTKATLLEASCVTVPADRYALVRAEREKAREFVDALYPDVNAETWSMLTTRDDVIVGDAFGETILRPGWEDTTPDDPKAGQIRHRIKEPSLFDEDTFKTLSLDVKGEGDVQLIRGQLKDGGEWDTQAAHFNKADGWTMDAAKTWWSEHEKEHSEKTSLVVNLNMTLDEAMQRLVAGETDEGLHALQAAIDARIGKVISAKNKSIIEEAITGAKQAVAALEAVLAAAEGGTEGEEHETDSDADRQADDELRNALKRIAIGA